MVSINKIIDYENGELDNEEAIEMFQEMIDDGSVWQLQGSYGRTAIMLIEEGACYMRKEAWDDDKERLVWKEARE